MEVARLVTVLYPIVQSALPQRLALLAIALNLWSLNPQASVLVL